MIEGHQASRQRISNCIALLGLLTSIIAIACVAPGQFSDAKEWPVERSIVAGHVRFIIEGKVQGVPGSFGWIRTPAYQGTYRLLLHREGETRARVYQLKGAGFFFWSLEPGSYRVVGIEREINQYSFRFMELGAEFRVPAERGDFHLPTFDVVMDDDLYGFNLAEEREVVEAAARERYSDQEASLERLTVMIRAEIGKLETLTSACNTTWARECTRTWHGVTWRGVQPVNPPVSTAESDLESRPFVHIESLEPTFLWEGSSDTSVEYDLVIYEALPYRYFGLSRDRYSLGSVVLYEEGLDAPEFRMKRPLEPNRQYFWSVRYRHGGMVSEWSSYSYAIGVPLIYWSTAGGLRYGFETGE
jgi:hypothetical protein